MNARKDVVIGRKVIDLILYMGEKDYSVEQIEAAINAITNKVVAKEHRKERKTTRRKWKKDGRWVRRIERTTPSEKTSKNMTKIYDELKERKQLSVGDIQALLNIKHDSAIRYMHLCASRLPHIERFREGRYLYLIWKE